MTLSRNALALSMTLFALVSGCRGGDKGDPVAVTTTQVSTSTSTSTTATGPQAELTAASRVRLDGIGPVVMLMTLAEASEAVGRTVAVVPESLINQDDTDSCGFADVQGGPDGLGFMVNRDGPADPWRIVRLDVSGKTVTGAGVGVGSTEDELKAAYGDKIRTEPHHYTADEGGHYVILDVDGPGGMRLLFETDGTRVETYRSGLESAVDAVEGCL
ncbi:MAG: hypothetical protein ACR2KK_11380 [Acidimicrobiales bacterium]